MVSTSIHREYRVKRNTVNFVYNDTPGTKIVSVVIDDRHYIHRDGYNDVLPRMRRHIRYDGYNDGFYEDASL